MRYLISLLFLLTAPAAFACGADSNCPIGDRHYRIVMPEGHDGSTPVGALIWSHGYKGSAAGVMRNKGLRRMVLRSLPISTPSSKTPPPIITSTPTASSPADSLQAA